MTDHRDMSDPHDPSEFGIDQLSSADQDRLAAILDEYMIAVEEGQSPDAEAIIAENPTLEAPLRTYLSGLNMIQRAVDPVGAAVIPGVTGQLADYEMGDEIGRGSMGIVYSAIDHRNGEEVALKILSFGSALSDSMVERFAREARAARSLNHPNIVPVREIGGDGGVHYYSMQRIHGESLDRHIDAARSKRRLTTDGSSLLTRTGRYREIARRVAEVADALHSAHGKGIIHRDIKPSNLLVDADGRLWVTDFGLVRILQDQSLTKTGDLIGTYRYMSPEQARGRPDLIGPHTDIYALGATLYEMLALRPLFRGNDSARLLRRIDGETPLPPSHWDPTIPRDLETIVLKAICQDHTGRYESAGAMADDLRRFADGQPIVARREARVRRGLNWVGRRRRAIFAATAVLLLLIGSAAAVKTLPVGDLLRGSSGDLELRSQYLSSELADLSRRDTKAPELLADYERAIGIANEHGGRAEIIVLLVRAINGLASVLIERGDFDRAAETLELAGEPLAAIPDSSRWAVMLGAMTAANRASALAKMNEVEAAKESANQAKSLLQVMLDSEGYATDLALHRQLADALMGLSEVLFEQKNTQIALDLARLTVSVTDRMSSGGDPILATRYAAISRSNLGALLFQSGDVSASVGVYEASIVRLRALADRTLNSGSVRVQLAVTLNNLGRSQSAVGDAAAASESFGESLAILEPMYQANKSDRELARRTAGVLRNKSVLLSAAGDQEGARRATAKADLIFPSK